MFFSVNLTIPDKQKLCSEYGDPISQDKDCPQDYGAPVHTWAVLAVYVQGYYIWVIHLVLWVL